MWTFSITTGAVSHEGLRIGRGYSGHGQGRGNAKLCAVKDVGPIPEGRYQIGPATDDHPDLGPMVMALTPFPQTETFGRSGFFMHGDSLSNPGNASHGCICLPPAVRRAINNSADKVLEVVE